MRMLFFCAAFATGLVLLLPSAVSAAFPYSSNWAGYIASGKTDEYTSVAGSWTIPEANGSPRSSDAAWIGIGGAQGSNDLIQTGTMAVVSTSGKTTYLAWIEALPHGLTGIPVKVSPGDQIQASIENQGGNEWLVSLKDLTRGQSYSTTVNYRSSKSSAEWIEERPTARNGLAPLDSFGSVSFTDASATVNGSAESLSQLHASPITMVGNGHTTLAQTSSVNANGFTVTQTNTSELATAEQPEQDIVSTNKVPVVQIHIMRARSGFVQTFIIRF